MPESFGVRLRQRRESQGISLKTIADETKIKQSLLEGLERDDVSRWPSGIFRRAYVRAYAAAIGLDPDVVVREFVERHPEKAEVVETLSAIAAAASPSRPQLGAGARLRNVLSSAMGSLSRERPGHAGDTPEVAADESDVSDDPSAIVSVTRTSLPLDFLAVSRLCTELGRARTTSDVQRVLPEAAGLLGAVGMIVWVWEGLSRELRPALVHGYSAKVLAQLPPVKRDSDNATAAAFRTAETCVVSGGAGSSGALAVPLLTPAGCAGVLAIELHAGRDLNESVRAAATILAAMLSQLVVGATAVDELLPAAGSPRQLPFSGLLP